MNASVSAHHEAVLRQEDARLEAPITPRRKLVVPSVFVATPKTNNRSFSKGSPAPKKLKIPLAFATAPTSSPFHTPKETVKLQQPGPCETPFRDVIEGPSPEEEETPHVDCATGTPVELQTTQEPIAPSSDDPTVPTTPSKELSPQNETASTPMVDCSVVQTTQEPIAPSTDDPTPPTTPSKELSPQNETASTQIVDCSVVVPVDLEEPVTTHAFIDGAQSPTTPSKRRHKKKLKSIQDEKHKEAIANQKQELMEQLLSLNTKIEAAKQRSRRNLAVEELPLAVETTALADDEQPAPFSLVELIDDSSSEKADEEARIEEVSTIDCPNDQTNDTGDQRNRETAPTEVCLLPTLITTEVHPLKTRKIREQLKKKRLVRLGSFFARRRKSKGR